MRKFQGGLKALVILLLAVVIISLVIAPRSGKGIIPWRTDLPAAREEARQAQKPLFIEFSAGWCPPCQEMARTTWSDKSVAEALRKMVPVQIDCDSHPDLVHEYAIGPIPAYLVVAPDGKVLQSTTGYRTPHEFLAWLKSAGQ